MRFSLKESLQKAASYCSRQERCHFEVKERLAAWGIYGEEAESIIAELISLNYLNEQRFAEAFAIGKFRQKGWGKRKIIAGLRKKRVPQICVDTAIKSIPDEEYIAGLRKVAMKRAGLEKATDGFRAKQRVINYLVQRGFEPDLSRAVMDEEEPFG